MSNCSIVRLRAAAKHMALRIVGRSAVEVVSWLGLK